MYPAGFPTVYLGEVWFRSIPISSTADDAAERNAARFASHRAGMPSQGGLRMDYTIQAMADNQRTATNYKGGQDTWPKS